MADKNPNCAYGHWDCMPCTNCDAYIPPQTNADRIRAMSDEELEKVLGMMANGNVFDLICDNPKRTIECDAGCVKCIAEWLKQPAKSEGNE